MMQPLPYGTPPPHRRRNRGGSAGLWLMVLAVVLGSISFGFTMLSGAVASDVCRVGCSGDINTAAGISLGGIVLGAVVGVAGSIWARRRGHPTWPWPALACVVIVLTGVIGTAWLNSLVLSPSY